MPSTLNIDRINKRFGNVTAIEEVSIRVEPGELLSLLGPSGCGKTTLLRMVAGLEQPTGGEISIDGRVVSSATTMVPPEHRHLGMVFQSYAVWPHMTVFDNVAFGLRMQRKPAAAIAPAVKDALELVGLGQFGERYPTQMSGGQQQRIALARALVTEPSILLLDEPLSNLDAKLRETMRFEIRALQKRLGITTLYVTHSQDEALASSDRIVVMNHGVLQQIGSPHDLYHAPVNRFVAEFVGLANVVQGQLESVESGGGTIRLNDGSVAAATNPGNIPAGEEAVLVIRPEAVSLSGQPKAEGIAGTVSRVSFVGNLVDYFIQTKLADAPIRVQSTPPVAFEAGASVTLTFDKRGLILVRP